MRKSWMVLAVLAMFLPVLFMGCEGDDGAPGAQGPPGIQGDQGETGADATAATNPESCAVCHAGAGDAHQAVYNQYADATKLAVTIDDVVSVPVGDPPTYTVTMTFTVTQNGQPYGDPAGLPSFSNAAGGRTTFYATRYDSATRRFLDSRSFPLTSATPTGTPGQYTVTNTGFAFAPETSNAIVYMYLAKDQVTSHGSIILFDEMINVGRSFGDADSYESAAVVSGCEKCHGAPYAKHGYRMAEVGGLTDFAACKTCHYDTRNGGHRDWQVIMDDPLRWATNNPPLEPTEYTYTANVMNDVHMSHAMEFPYPQSMANCVTCHEGKLDMILTDANFTVKTCKSCHPVTGSTAYSGGTAGNGMMAVSSSNPSTSTLALKTIIPPAIHGSMNLDTVNCTLCHAEGTGIKVFRDIHTGYDKSIYHVDAATGIGTKYSDEISVTIDSASFDSATKVLTFAFSAAGSLGGADAANIVPTVLVGLYGYNTKDYIQGPHESDPLGHKNSAPTPSTLRALEYTVGASPTTGRNSPYIEVNGGTVTVDLSQVPLWAGWIDNGYVTKAEVAVMPKLTNAAGDTVALVAPSKTVDLATGNFVDPPAVIVKVEDGCNACHEALGTTFHSPDRGGNIVVCRLCHTTKSGGSHLEMQSRSIDSYVHAIHSFQPFDIQNIDFTDPVKEKHYEDHVGFVYPYFTLQACESCHVAGKYNVPDQSKSLAGVLSRSRNAAQDASFNMERNIGAVPSYVTGPASRACGACHRAEKINADDAGALAAFNSHTKTFGYLVEYTGSTVLDSAIETIMEMM